MIANFSIIRARFFFVLKYVFGLFLVGVLSGYGALYAHEHALPTLLAAVSLGSDEVAIASTTPPIQEPRRIVSNLTIAESVPRMGKFIAADLVDMKLYLYEDAVRVGEYSILTKGRPGSPYETPGGFYSVLFKNESHFNKTAKVYLPYSMQFYGNYFIHGWPYYEGGMPVGQGYSGGCIRLNTEDAEKVFDFAEKNTGVFVYDPGATVERESLVLNRTPLPKVSAASYLIADIDTGDVLAEKLADYPRPIASVTKLVTALVANETIMYNRQVPVTVGELARAGEFGSPKKIAFPVEELLYPLLMESNNKVADRLASYFDTKSFVEGMNGAARALNMTKTNFADPSGISPENLSSAEDLFKLAVYLTNKKSFIWDATRTTDKALVSSDGTSFPMKNFNHFQNREDFIGGKVGTTNSARDTMVSVFRVSAGESEHRVAIILLRSDSHGADTAALVDWVNSAVAVAHASSQAACAGCAGAQEPVRKIPVGDF